MTINRTLLIAAATVLAWCAAWFAAGYAYGRDNGQWGDTDPAIAQWYKTLMQPDNPMVPCCGESDAYYADSYEISGDQYVAIITDERPDEPFKREHVEVGTRVVIPNNKLKYDAGNPTGHGIVFLRVQHLAGGVIEPWVYCYLAPGGV